MHHIYNINADHYQSYGGLYPPTGSYLPTGTTNTGWSTGPSLLQLGTGTTGNSQIAFDVSTPGKSHYGYAGQSYDPWTGLPSSLLSYGAQKARQINDQLGLTSIFASIHSILAMPFTTSSTSNPTYHYGSSTYVGTSGSSGSSDSSGTSDTGNSDSSGSTGSSGSSGSTGSSGSASSSGSSGSAGSAGSASSSPSSGSSSPSAGNGPFKGGKEGLGVNDTSSNGDGSNLASTKASWYYNWSPNASSKVHDPNATFVPMIWGKGNMNAKDLEAAKNSDSPMILTFNEPDLASQGNMSTDEALSYWDQLEATGKQLSSPAITNGPDGIKWLDDFMTKAAASGKRVDSISLHWYGSSSQPTDQKVAALKDYIESVHKKYPDKPINLTEFGVDASGLSAGKDQAFLTAAEKMLNGLDYVQMYAPYGTGDINGN